MFRNFRRQSPPPPDEKQRSSIFRPYSFDWVRKEWNMKKVHHENRAKLILPDSDRIGYTRTELLDGFCPPRRPLLHSFRESPSCKKTRTLSRRFCKRRCSGTKIIGAPMSATTTSARTIVLDLVLEAIIINHVKNIFSQTNARIPKGGSGQTPLCDFSH